MALPKQVQDAERRAEELLKEKDETAEETTEEIEQPPQEDEGPEKAYTDLKHKFDVLQGKYNAEVVSLKEDVNYLNRLKKDNRDLRSQVVELTAAQAENARLLAELRKQLQDKPAAVQTQPGADPLKALSRDEIEHLEAESLSGKTLDIFMKLIRSAAPQAREVDFSDIEKKVQSVEEQVKKTRQQSWTDRLYSVIPDFDKYVGEDADPRFAKWLDNPLSDFSSRTRRDEMQTALDAQDVHTLKKGIDLFKASVKTAKAPAVEPNETAAPAEPVAPEKKVWSMSEVRSFYTDVSKGKYDKRPKEEARINKEIMLATKEGRIKQ
jgi:DNA repair exonuclease SbcCD ATPase subunit